MHQVYNPKPMADKPLNLDREDFVLHNKLEDNKKILTIRTQYVLVNKTTSVYKMRQFFVNKTKVNGKERKEINIYNEATILPGEAFPMPDDKDLTITERMKICVKPISCKKWSDEFKVTALKDKLECDLNI
jgi:hypothetical protein